MDEVMLRHTNVGAINETSEGGPGSALFLSVECFAAAWETIFRILRWSFFVRSFLFSSLICWHWISILQRSFVSVVASPWAAMAAVSCWRIASLFATAPPCTNPPCHAFVIHWAWWLSKKMAALLSSAITVYLVSGIRPLLMQSQAFKSSAWVVAVPFLS